MKILLAIDDSPASALAIEEVATGQWPAGTEVDVLNVVETGPAWGHAEGLQSAYEHSLALIKNASAAVRAAGFHANGNVAVGDTKAVILDYAAKTAADLIVLGSHRVSTIAHFLLGNTAAYTLRHAHCSVLIVRGPRAANAPRKLLLATDGSAPAEEAARAIAMRSWPAGTAVRVLSVVEVVLPTMHALFDPPFIHSTEVQRLREEALLRAQNAVGAASAILAPAGLDVSESVSVLIDGTRAVILNEARDCGADTIFVGSHGYGVTERFLLGSVSEWLATHAACSVEVVRPRAKEPGSGA